MTSNSQLDQVKQIKAIIFDCFGVLTTDGWKHIRETFCTTDEMRLAAHHIDKAVNAGEMPYRQFVTEIASLTSRTESEISAALGQNVPNAELFRYIRNELKPHYSIGMLSNAADNWLDELFESEDVKLFDEVVLSYEVGATKPDAKMYDTIAARLRVKPIECVFIDDVSDYVQGAKATGMSALQYSTFEQFKNDLEAML